jgi:hypothetical protein
VLDEREDIEYRMTPFELPPALNGHARPGVGSRRAAELLDGHHGAQNDGARRLGSRSIAGVRSGHESG